MLATCPASRAAIRNIRISSESHFKNATFGAKTAVGRPCAAWRPPLAWWLVLISLTRLSCTASAVKAMLEKCFQDAGRFRRSILRRIKPTACGGDRIAVAHALKPDERHAEVEFLHVLVFDQDCCGAVNHDATALRDIAIGHLYKLLAPAFWYGKAVNRQWGCGDGADVFSRSSGLLRKCGRQAGPSGC